MVKLLAITEGELLAITDEHNIGLRCHQDALLCDAVLSDLGVDYDGDMERPTTKDRQCQELASIIVHLANTIRVMRGS